MLTLKAGRMAKDKLLLITFLVWLVTGCTNSTPSGINIIPRPEQQTIGKGHFTFNKSTTIRIENQEQEAVAGLLADLFTTSAGFTPTIGTDSSFKTASVVFLPTQHSLKKIMNCK